MAIRTDGSSYVYLSSGVLDFSSTPYTMLWKYMHVSNSGDWEVMAAIFEDDGDRYDLIESGSTGFTSGCHLLSDPQGTFEDTDFGFSLTLNVWYTFAITRTGGTLKGYIVESDGTVHAVTRSNTNAHTTTSNRIEFGTCTDWPGEYANGRFGPIIIWTRVLTQTEIVSQARSILPQNPTDIFRIYPAFPGATERLRDYSSAMGNFTASGSLTDEAGPPVSWGIYRPPWPVFVTAGGTTYNQSVAGTITPAGALILQGQKVLVGAFTPAGLLVRQGQKVLAGAAAPAGDLVRQTQRALTGAITPGGVLTALRTAYAVLTGSIAPAGALVKEAQKVLSGGITPAGGLINQAQKMLDGAVTPAGALSSQVQKILSGALSPAGSLANQAQKVLSGIVTPAGAIIKQTQTALSGAITPTGALATIKTFLLSLAGAIAPGGTLVKEAQKTLAGTITPAGTAGKLIGKILAGSITPAGVLAASRTVFISLTGTIAPAGTLVRQTQKTLAGAVTPAGAIVKQTGKILSGLFAPVGTLTASLVSSGAEVLFRGMFRGMFRRMR